MTTLPVRKREREQSALARLHDEMDDLLRGFFRDWDLPVWDRDRWPALDIAETASKAAIDF